MTFIFKHGQIIVFPTVVYVDMDKFLSAHLSCKKFYHNIKEFSNLFLCFYRIFTRGEDSRPEGGGGEIAIKELTMKNGELYLDGEKIENLRSYNISSSAKENGIAELEIVIDVITGLDSIKLEKGEKQNEDEQRKILKD